jgi:hypothetical protein
MKKYISYVQIYFKKISSFFFVKNKEPQKILGSIRFEIDEESKINVSCLFPEFSDFANIESLSQTFAKFLYMTINSKMREEILSIIKSNSSSPEDTLFYENLIFNLVLIEQEKRNNITNNQNQPIIKPSQVFSIARQK